MKLNPIDMLDVQNHVGTLYMRQRIKPKQRKMHTCAFIKKQVSMNAWEDLVHRCVKWCKWETAQGHNNWREKYKELYSMYASKYSMVA